MFPFLASCDFTYYLCIVFFIVLDLRLTKGWDSAESFFCVCTFRVLWKSLRLLSPFLYFSHQPFQGVDPFYAIIVCRRVFIECQYKLWVLVFDLLQ